MIGFLACPFKMHIQDQMMYSDIRIAPTGSNHHTFCEVLAIAPKAMAPRLLTMSFLWSSASASIESAQQPPTILHATCRDCSQWVVHNISHPGEYFLPAKANAIEGVAHT